MQLDKWQEDVLNTTGHIALRSGRQVGKSTVISIKAAEFALQNAKSSTMIISATERQAYLLFSKVLAYIHDNYKAHIKAGKDRPTKSEIKLKNGSVIRCLPTGTDGLGIRGYTVDLLIADEAAFIPDDVWAALTPMLATTGGSIILLSTPFGRRGYFYERFGDDKFTKFHVSTEEVAMQRPEPQRSNMLENCEQEKKRMSKLQYAQEYLGEFLGGLGQLFPDELIKRAQTAERSAPSRGRQYFLGVDVARMGGDESTFEVLDGSDRESIRQVESVVSEKQYLTETTQTILNLEKAWQFKQIGIDDGGMGVGVFDPLLKEPTTKSKIIAINNASRSLDRDEKRTKKLLKEDLYMNLLALMEQTKIKLLKDENIFFSLRSVQFERTDDGNIKIHGNYTHIAEGLIRAAWLANRKHNKLWVRGGNDGAGNGKHNDWGLRN